MKHNNVVNTVFPVSAYDEFHKSIPDFCKQLPWFYEKEFRIVVKVKSEEIKKHLKDSNTKLAVCIQESLYPKLKVRLGPESKIEKIDDFPGIKKFVASKLEKSELTDIVKMNLKSRLCKHCSYNTK